jgi:CheY-like chemotaxis protein
MRMASGSSVPTSSPRVLIVDDEPLVAELLAEMLAESGTEYRVQSASTGPDALVALSRDAVDVILLDINMPGMNGLEALKAIKHLYPEIPILMVTAAHYSAAAEALLLGALAYIPKPFNGHYIHHLVASALGTRPAR